MMDGHETEDTEGSLPEATSAGQAEDDAEGEAKRISTEDAEGAEDDTEGHGRR